MAEENQAQEPEQEQELPQEAEPAQEPEEQQQEDKPAEEEKKDGGLLMPILYALLAAVGAFTLIMIIGIVLTIVFNRPSETPSEEASAQVVQTESPQSPDSEDSD